MKVVNIFIGSGAIRWSKYITYPKLLIGNTKDKLREFNLIHSTRGFCLINGIPGHGHGEHWERKKYWEYLKHNNFIDLEKELEVSQLVNRSKEIQAATDINIIFAAGGLYSTVITPLVLRELNSLKCNIRIVAMRPIFEKIMKVTPTEFWLIDYIEKEYNYLPINYVGYQQVDNYKGSNTIEFYMKQLDRIVINTIKELQFNEAQNEDYYNTYNNDFNSSSNYGCSPF